MNTSTHDFPTTGVIDVPALLRALLAIAAQYPRPDDWHEIWWPWKERPHWHKRCWRGTWRRPWGRWGRGGRGESPWSKKKRAKSSRYVTIRLSFNGPSQC